MIKKLLKALVLMSVSCSSLHAMNMNYRRVEVGAAARGGYPEFFTSFARPEATYFDEGSSGVFFSKEQPIVDRVPLIGHYQNSGTKKSGQTHGDEYNSRARIAFIEYKNSALARVIPASVRAALERAGIKDLSNVEFYTNIIGDFVYSEQAPFGGATNSCNVAFHPVIRRWKGTGYTNFNVKVQAGIFEQRGINPRGGGIAFGVLAPLDVSYHDREAFSPDNGRFNYDPSCGISTFWVIGVYGGHASVTFTIMAHNRITEQLLLGITDQDEFGGVLHVLKRASANRELTSKDVVALTEAIIVLQRATGISAGERVLLKQDRVVAGSSASSRPASKSLFDEQQKGKGHILGGTQRAIDPRQVVVAAAQKRVESRRKTPSKSFFGPVGATSVVSSSVRPTVALDPESRQNLEDMVSAFENLALHGDLDSAQSLLLSIRALDPAQAELCELMLD